MKRMSMKAAVAAMGAALLVTVAGCSTQPKTTDAPAGMHVGPAPSQAQIQAEDQAMQARKNGQ